MGTINNYRNDAARSWPGKGDRMNTPLQIKGSDTTVRICDANGKTLATINKALGEDDYKTAQAIVSMCNVHDELLAACEILLSIVSTQNGNLYDDTNKAQIIGRAAIEKAKVK
ncbi:MAG: hypothetical protein PHW03_05395 [Eubacteriales bacterium]|nr:hypothetical protein [Eubacteriales bacterium]